MQIPRRPILNSLVKLRYIRSLAFPDGRQFACVISILYRIVVQTAHSYSIAAAISSMPRPKSHHIVRSTRCTGRAACSKYYRIYRMRYPFASPLPPLRIPQQYRCQKYNREPDEISICLWNGDAARLIDFKPIFFVGLYPFYLFAFGKKEE